MHSKTSRTGVPGTSRVHFGAVTLSFPVIALSGCTVGPDYIAPTANNAPIAAQFSAGGSQPASRAENIRWWTGYNDAPLNALIIQALAQNLSVKQAIERINVANSSILQARGLSYPTVGGVAASTREKDSDGVTTEASTIGASAFWMIDITGKNRRNLEIALAQLESAEANVVASKLVLVGDVVRTYVRLRGKQAEAQIARDTIAQTRNISRLTHRRFDRGVVTALDVKLADARLSEAQSELPLLLAEFETEVNHLATLLARPAQSIRGDLVFGAPQPVGKLRGEVGVPADLLRNRYDIKSIERDLAAITAQIGVAEAELYPSLTLLGSVAAVTQGSNTWSFGPQLNMPILNRSALRGRVARVRSEAAEQYLTWQSSVLSAVEQVENALVRRKRQHQSMVSLRRNVSQLTKAQKLALESYERGVVPLQELIDTNLLLSAARAGLAQSRTDFGLTYAELQLALGGFVE